MAGELSLKKVPVGIYRTSSLTHSAICRNGSCCWRTWFLDGGNKQLMAASGAAPGPRLAQINEPHSVQLH